LSATKWLRIPPMPACLEPALRPSADPSARDWMARNSVDAEDVMSSAWSLFLLVAVMGSLASIALMLWLGTMEALAGMVVALVAPFIASSWASNRPARMAKRESLSYLRYAPSVIGAMAMSMIVSPSIERAVLFASRSSRNPLGKRLAKASWEVLTRSQQDVESALADLASSLGQYNHALRQSLHLFTASSHEPSKEGMEQLMEKAHEISVQGLKDAADRYVAGLSTPVMVIFALGILLPIMLLSIVPLFAMTSPIPGDAVVMGSSAAPLAPMAFLILVVIPMSCLAYSSSLLAASPLADLAPIRISVDAKSAWPWPLWLFALVVYSLMVQVADQPYLTLALVAAPPSLILLSRSNRGLKEVDGAEGDFILGLYQLGNRLSTGTSLEKAVTEAAEVQHKDQFAEWCSLVLHRSSLARVPLDEAFHEFEPLTRRPLLAEAFRTVARCAMGDAAAAGRIAVRLAKSLGQIKQCEDGIKERMRGVVDMMRSTSLVFAPIVLGVTVGLFSLTASFSGDMEATGWVTLVAGIYVIELAFVVTYLTTFIVENKGWGQLARSFALRMPLAVLAFTSVSLLSRAGFAQWW